MPYSYAHQNEVDSLHSSYCLKFGAYVHNIHDTNIQQDSLRLIPADASLRTNRAHQRRVPVRKAPPSMSQVLFARHVGCMQTWTQSERLFLLRAAQALAIAHLRLSPLRSLGSILATRHWLHRKFLARRLRILPGLIDILCDNASLWSPFSSTFRFRLLERATCRAYPPPATWEGAGFQAESTLARARHRIH